jgi:NADP-dependent 3-hydroxy acid dehydrogenase YdfG
MLSALVTGGGSGVGRAVTKHLVQAGWRVAILGRRAEALEATVALAPNRIRAEVCDIVDPDAVAAVRDRLQADWSGLDAVVNAAGTNIPVRSWTQVTPADFREVIEINLLGVFHVTSACLPLMAGREGATVVTIISDAGLLANAKAGASYVASKFGATGLVESLNAELRGQGIRSCGIFPGDIDTDLLNRRPVPPDAAARALMLQPDDVAACVMLAITLPARAVVEKLLVRPR